MDHENFRDINTIKKFWLNFDHYLWITNKSEPGADFVRHRTCARAMRLKKSDRITKQLENIALWPVLTGNFLNRHGRTGNINILLNIKALSWDNPRYQRSFGLARLWAPMIQYRVLITDRLEQAKLQMLLTYFVYVSLEHFIIPKNHVDTGAHKLMAYAQ